MLHNVKKKCVNIVQKSVKTGTFERPVTPVNVTRRFTKINKREYQKPITLHNRFKVLQNIDENDKVEMHCVSDQKNIVTHILSVNIQTPQHSLVSSYILIWMVSQKRL